MNQGSLLDAQVRLLSDIAEVGHEKWRRRTRMTVPQTMEAVFGRKRSIGMSGLPCWLWGSVYSDEGTFDVDVDVGWYATGLYDTNKSTGRTTNIRYNIAADHIESAGAWDAVFGSEHGCYDSHGRFRDLIDHGIEPGQDFLLRVEADWHRTAYECDEWDLDWGAEFVWVGGDPEPNWMETVIQAAQDYDAEEDRRALKELEDRLRMNKGKGKAKLIPTPAGQKIAKLRQANALGW